MTTAADWQPATKLNLERALRLGDELGGHMVSGHVDGIAELVAATIFADMARLTFRAAGGACPLHRAQGLGRARWRFAHRQ